MSNEFANFHINKLNDLRNQALKTPNINPAERLQSWIYKKGLKTPIFDVKKIKIARLDLLVKKLNPEKAFLVT